MVVSEMKTIPGFPNYSISKDGRIWSKPRKNTRGFSRKGRWLKPGLSSGYPYVNLRQDSKSHVIRVHRLVLETYVGFRPAGMECRHLDSNPQNNNLENLCWDTHKNNLADRKFVDNPQLTEQDVQMIKQMWRMGLYTQREIAKMYGIHPSTLGYWLRGTKRKHLIGKLKRIIEQENRNKKRNLSCLYGEKLPGSKLTDNEVRAIRYLRYIVGFSLKELAWQFDSSTSNISCVCLRQTWRHL